ncbi:hypothetical protein [Mesorhizobium sp. M1329]|uniref:hypothetical protein n=1 Tax=Mesorhizobium sp. M1329 TaxID=2957083 RepID=UPI003339C426
MTEKIWIDGVGIEGEAEKIKPIVEAYIEARVKAGLGAVITDATGELTQWAIELEKKFPWTPPEAGLTATPEVHAKTRYYKSLKP